MIFGSFYLAADTQNRKIFARLRRDFSPYRVLKSKIFARAFGAIDMHGIEWPYCAAGKKILVILDSNHHDFPLEMKQTRHQTPKIF